MSDTQWLLNALVVAHEIALLHGWGNSDYDALLADWYAHMETLKAKAQDKAWARFDEAGLIPF